MWLPLPGTPLCFWVSGTSCANINSFNFCLRYWTMWHRCVYFRKWLWLFSLNPIHVGRFNIAHVCRQICNFLPISCICVSAWYIETFAKIGFHIQSSAVITRFNMIRYCINNCRNRDRISIRCCIHKRHPIARPDGRAMGCLLLIFLRKLTAL